jgi:hypothetical protein
MNNGGMVILPCGYSSIMVQWNFICYNQNLPSLLTFLRYTGWYSVAVFGGDSVNGLVLGTKFEIVFFRVGLTNLIYTLFIAKLVG